MNPVVHFELPYKVSIRVRTFYKEVFGWQLQALGSEMGDYILATTAVSDAKSGSPAGAINGAFFPINPELTDQCPSFVIAVDDIDQSIQKICAWGGKLLNEPHEIPGTGWYVSFRDTEGNRVSILQTNRK